ncbi:N-terminal acetyltransferase A, auxiliary subunit [Hortaea werneckii]|nr:N-terminal acetyltransferase A, auxiliary subunit [Hortaea werneckii]
MAQNNQVLPSKEASLFRHVVQNYESKQYKKGLKAADQILRKYPNHGDTQAMKALIVMSQGKTEEAFDLCKLALKNAMKSHICWHVYGLLYRQQKNYEEAIKAYRFALRLEPENAQIQRDLALLQMQMRDYNGYVQSRRQMLAQRPGFRQNWTALAIGLHLQGDLPGAEDVLQRYEESLRQTPPKADIEHAEAVLYKNEIMAEIGDYERALQHLDSFYKSALDRTAVMEMRADYLLKLGRKDEAEKAYLKLLKRNTEHRDYYEALEKARGLDRSKKEDAEKLGQMYHSLAEQSDRIDAARRIPLDFKEGDEFRQHADKYLRRMFKKGVPSTFANVKQLYADPAKKETIQQLVEGYLKEEPQENGDAVQTNGTTNGNLVKPPPPDAATTWKLSVNYFLALHYDYILSRDLNKAQQHIDAAIAVNPSPTDYTYHMSRARILKHTGDVAQASEAMNKAREMDVKDRYINTKCAKYQLRNDQNTEAIKTMGMFTRKEAIGGPLGDLLDMQCTWYLTEDAESFLRQGKLAMSLKRFQSLYDIFEVWQEDQFDFHSFSLRKGMVRAYVDMLRWEDGLREHPFFSRAALSAIRIYCLLHDRPEIGKGGGQLDGANGESAADKKKAAKKAKREAEKAEQEKKAQAAKKAQPAKVEDGEQKKEDQDPDGTEAFKIAAEKPLEEAMKYLQPLLELSPKNIDCQIAGFEVFLRRGKYLPALKCHLATEALQSNHPKVHEQSCRLRFTLEQLSEPLPDKVKQVVEETFSSKTNKSKSVDATNEEYLQQHQSSLAHVKAVVRVRYAMKPADDGLKSKSVQDMCNALRTKETTLPDAVDGLTLLQEMQVSSDAKDQYLAAGRERWPAATAFKQR